MSARQSVEAEILARITPTPEEERATQAVARDLIERCNQALAEAGVAGEATVQGSIAKGTWLAGGGDIDLFLLLDLDTPEDGLEAITEAVGGKVLQDAHRRYAQHPYLIGTFGGRAVDLVPAYRVAAAGAHMSAVDRTPFHTAWVKGNLDGRARGQARLLKQFLKGIGAYGAQTAVGGFSGYLAEVLVARFASFDAVLGWLAADAKPRRIAIGLDQVEDDVAVLVVVDPVDAARNCAAAVQAPTLELAALAAKAYISRPDARFFFPAPPRAEPAATLQAALARQVLHWSGLALRPRTDRLDIVLPQFQRAMRSLATGLEQAGFPVRRMDCCALPDESQVFMQWATAALELPPTRLHRGPPDDGRPNADRFRSKWKGHPDAVSPLRAGADGRLELELRVPARTAAAWLALNFPKMPLGRHVEDAVADARHFTDPARASVEWGPRVADFVLDRKPWER
jgi:tRNA nucleotidyltransferase (CCA-adding enzyme)